MTENETIKERLISFIKSLGIGQGKFESQCGLANGYVNNIRRSITPEKLQQIALCFPMLNTGWLMTGEGEMLKQDSYNIKTGEVVGNGNSIGSPVNQNIGEVTGQNAGRDIHIAASCDNEIWLKELEKQRLLTEKAQHIAETAQTQLSTALAQITDLINQNKEQFNQFMGLLQTLKSV